MANKKIKLYTTLLVLAIVLVTLDQFTKYLAVQHLMDGDISMIEGVFRLQYCENTGTGFSLFAGKKGFILVTNILILLLLLYWMLVMPKSKRFVPVQVILTCITSGALGNMVDRIRLGYVVDFFYFELIDFPIFNVADIYVTVSVFALAVLILFYYKESEAEQLLNFRWKKQTNSLQNEDV